LLNIKIPELNRVENKKFVDGLAGMFNGQVILQLGQVKQTVLQTFGIKQPVFFADFYWELLVASLNNTIEFEELPKQLPVNRDLAIVVDKFLPYGEVEKTIRDIGLPKLHHVQLFDIFESDKIGAGKKSLALSLVFLDQEKTLTDQEVESMMNKIILTLENELKAEIRK
jgi:phenylalanyl-tRNA synthetase beta chain